MTPCIDCTLLTDRVVSVDGRDVARCGACGTEEVEPAAEVALIPVPETAHLNTLPPEAERWRVITGDCLTVIPTLPAFDHVITDGPYGVGDNDATSDDSAYVDALAMLAECKSIAFFGYAEKIVAWLMRLQWPEPDEWVTWYPTNAEAKAGARSRHRLPRTAEHIAIYGEIPGVRSVRRERSAGGTALAQKKGINTRWSGGRTLEVTAQAGDVWTDASPGIAFLSSRRLHPNEKPVSLLEKLVLLMTAPGGTVLDPFCGSGSTGVAAIRHGRRFIGIEKNPDWAELSRERLRAEESGSTLRARRAGQVALF